jgi:hypothetical protein
MQAYQAGEQSCTRTGMTENKKLLHRKEVARFGDFFGGDGWNFSSGMLCSTCQRANFTSMRCITFYQHGSALSDAPDQSVSS